MEDVKEQNIVKNYLEKERFTQKFDELEKMGNEKSIKELTNQEFLSLFKELPENKELKEKGLLEVLGKAADGAIEKSVDLADKVLQAVIEHKCIIY